MPLGSKGDHMEFLSHLLFKLASCRENKEVSSNVKIPSPRLGSGRPTTSPKETSSPRRPASRKGLERSATQPEITKKESPRRSAHVVSIATFSCIVSPPPLEKEKGAQ